MLASARPVEGILGIQAWGRVENYVTAMSAVSVLVIWIKEKNCAWHVAMLKILGGRHPLRISV